MVAGRLLSARRQLVLPLVLPLRHACVLFAPCNLPHLDPLSHLPSPAGSAGGAKLGTTASEGGESSISALTGGETGGMKDIMGGATGGLKDLQGGGTGNLSDIRDTRPEKR